MNAARPGRPLRRRLLIALALLALWASPVAAQVGSCALLPMRTDLRPDAGGRPVEVGVGLIVADIRAVDDTSRSLIGDFVVSLDWIDRRLTGLAGCRFPVASVWSPEVRPFGATDLRPAQLGAQDRVEVGEGGHVRHTQRFSGAIATGHRLERYPFDRHAFTLRLGSPVDGPEDLALWTAEDRSWRAERLSVEGWRFGELALASRVEQAPGFGARSVVEATLPAAREPLVPVVKVLLPTLIVVALSWAIFWAPPQRAEFEVGLCAAMLLVLLALQAAAANSLPRSGDLTLMDKLSLWATLAILLALLKSVVAGVLLARGADGAVERIDRLARLVIPAGFVVGWASILVL